MADGKLDAAIKEAFAEASEGATIEDDDDTDEGTAADEAPEADVEGDESDSEAPSEDGTDVDPREEDVPTSYFGTDLSGLPAKERADIIRTYEEQNKLISQRNREEAEARKAEAAPTTPAAPAEPEQEPELSDEALAQALGLDLEDPSDARTARASVPLARLVLDLKAQVAELSETGTVAAESAHWNGELDRLEAKFGELPVPRVELLEQAAAKGIGDPESAYWAAVGPLRAQLAEEVSKRLSALRTDGKKAATTPRPRSSTPVEATRLEQTDTKLAVAEAAELAARELGISWEDATRQKLPRR
jgi:hypothetical protein